MSVGITSCHRVPGCSVGDAALLGERVLAVLASGPVRVAHLRVVASVVQGNVPVLMQTL